MSKYDFITNKKKKVGDRSGKVIVQNLVKGLAPSISDDLNEGFGDRLESCHKKDKIITDLLPGTCHGDHGHSVVSRKNRDSNRAPTTY